jgi:hypothetical protein
MVPLARRMISSTPGFFQSSLSVHPAFGWAEDLAAKRRAPAVAGRQPGGADGPGAHGHAPGLTGRRDLSSRPRAG